MKEELNKTNNEVSDLNTLPDFSYERIFNVYKDDDYFVYNILKTVNIPPDIDSDLFFYVRVTGSTTWTEMSFLYYGSIRLWWLICLANKIMNPVILPTPGDIIRIIKPTVVIRIVNQISQKI